MTAAPMFDRSFAALGWAYRASQAVGSDRFAEAMFRARFYLERVAQAATTPAEQALVAGLRVMLDELITANARSRVLLADSVSGMNAMEAWAFVELCEAAADDEPV